MRLWLEALGKAVSDNRAYTINFIDKDPEKLASESDKEMDKQVAALLSELPTDMQPENGKYRLTFLCHHPPSPSSKPVLSFDFPSQLYPPMGVRMRLRMMSRMMNIIHMLLRMINICSA